MEKHLDEQTTVFCMDVSCCNHCPPLLEKKLMRLTGVDSVSIDVENRLVYVEGEIDATTLMNYVATLPKSAYLVPADKLNQMRYESRGNTSAAAAPEKGKWNKKKKDGRHSTMEQQVQQKGAHQCEDYKPAKYNEKVCRDFYCKAHPQGRSIVDKVPADCSSIFAMDQQMPFYGTYGPYGGGIPYQYPGWSWEDSPLTFGYDQQQMNYPYRPFGNYFQ